MLKAYDDFTLLREISHGSEKAFAVLFRRYKDKIYAFCLPIVQDSLLADEIVQEVMLKIWQMGDQLTSIANIDAFLKVLARNRAIDLLRHQRMRAQHSELSNIYWEEACTETEEQMMLKDARKILAEAINMLSPQQQHIYLLIEEEGLHLDEIAEKLGISVSTVQTHLKLARKSIRLYLKKHLCTVLILIIWTLC